MPVVVVEIIEGKTSEEKEKLIKGITRAFAEIGVRAESLYVIIHDIPRRDFGLRGEQASKLVS